MPLFPEMKPVFKIAIGIPCYMTWVPEFGISLVNLMAQLMTRQVPGYASNQVELIHKQSSILPKVREEIVADAILKGCEWLLFLDCDQTFPPDTVHRLIARQCPVIGANYPTKAIGGNPTARKRGAPIEGDKVFTLPESTGVEEVWRIGTGVLLINLETFRYLEQPWFNTDFRKESGFVGEDWWFCEKLEQLGVPIFVDHDLSKEVMHWGRYCYGHKDVDVGHCETNNGTQT
jgi:hypothetical protein